MDAKIVEKEAVDPGLMLFCPGVDGGGKDSCQGDSGGPIIKKNGGGDVQVGVVSWGIGCALDEFPGVYSKVSEVSGWIESVVCDEWGSSASFCDGGGGGGGGSGGGGGTDVSCNNNEIKAEFTLTTDGFG
jgi:hypothetical protein